ncbi:MAG: arginine--tRNA ligase [Clostridiales bacterium]|nr:arginine--tRNA ligase [Clostridiales bacterium]
MINMQTEARSEINALIAGAFSKAVQNGELSALHGGETLSGSVEIPKDAKNGDWAATHALPAAKKLGKNPREIAEALTRNMGLRNTYFDSVGIAGPGFINFTLSEKWYAGVLSAIENGGGDYGSSDTGSGERIMVEFVSANPTGPMTIGNARGGVLGDALASVLERAGFDVWREFYVNDAGNQIDLFGRSIDARYMQLCLGEDAVGFPEDGYHGDDIRELAQLAYDERGDSLRDMPGDERVRYFTNFGLPRNIELMRQHLERYRIHFDKWFLESSLHDSGYVEDTVKLLSESGLTYEKDGAVWLRNMELGADKDEVLLRSNGFFTYYAVDIAYHRNKFERGFDRVIDVWGADHHGHAVRFASTMAAPVLGISVDKLTFLIMQMVRMTRDGELIKVSKRTGRAMSLNDLLDEVSVDACRFFFNAKPDNHLEFDLGLAVRQDSENPVYYVQYAHARICSLIQTLEAEGYGVKGISALDCTLLSGAPERELIKQLAALPDESEAAARELDP